MNDEEWEKALIEYMIKKGWINDRNDEKSIGFSLIKGESHWIKDYDKKTRRFVQFDGNRKVDLKVKNE